MKRSEKWFTCLFVLYLIIVLTLLIVPFSNDLKMDEYIFGIRKDHYVHATMFSPFIGYFWITNRAQKSRLHFVGYYGIGILFAGFCESLHYFIPYRSFDVYDFFANITGISIGLLIFCFPSPKLR